MTSMKSRTNITGRKLLKRKLKNAATGNSNSAQTIRILQASNRSLTSCLEKMRQDFLEMSQHVTKLQQQNCELRANAFESRQKEIPAELFDMDFNKKYKKRLGNIKKKIFILNSIATGFVETLAELAEICYANNSPDATTCSVMASRSSVSPCTDKQVTSTDLSGTDRAGSSSVGTDFKQEDETTDVSLYDSTKLKNSQILEMRLNKEQCYIYTSDENKSVYSDESNETSKSSSSASLSIKKQHSHSEISTLKHTREPNKLSQELKKNAIAEFNKRSNNDSSENVHRKETFIIASNEFPNNKIISDVAMPQFLLLDYDDENEWIDTEIPAQISYESALPNASSLKKRQKRKHSLRKSKLLSNSFQEESSPYHIESAKKHLPHQTSSKRTKKKRSQSPTINSHADKENSKQFSGKTKNNKVNIFAPDTFESVNIHNQGLEKCTNKVSYVTTIQRCLPSHEAGKHIMCPVDSMKLLTGMGNGIIEHDKLSNKVAQVGETRNKMDSDVFKAHNSKNEQKDHTVCRAAEEAFLNDLIERLSSPHQYLHAYKQLIDSDRIFNNHTTVHSKTKLKSKKVKSEKKLNLRQANQQPNFDFTNKSPLFINTQKQKITLHVTCLPVSSAFHHQHSPAKIDQTPKTLL
uniref:Uncharacterized protein n=1 Tax=Arion vulgaris TaxID=1028688 RepID=A0A0B7AAF4_9EUPU